jgi:hypothetical protein
VLSAGSVFALTLATEVGQIAMSEYVALCLPSPRAVVTWIVTGPPGEPPLKSARERMDIISAYREVGTCRGAAVACGTESRCRSWSFLPLGAEARLS